MKSIKNIYLCLFCDFLLVATKDEDKGSYCDSLLSSSHRIKFHGNLISNFQIQVRKFFFNHGRDNDIVQLK